MQQVIPPMPGHNVEQQQGPSDDPRLGAGAGSGQRDHHVRGRHQCGNLVAETEGVHPMGAACEGTELPFQRVLATGYRQYVHAREGQRPSLAVAA